ncbi:MAG: DNA-processing protein DprA [Pseudomonadales bacterium]|nr:DNA-processing protein DprA [Pseudomonadales bacterium]
MWDTKQDTLALKPVSDIQYWLALWRLKGVGPVFFKRVLNEIGDPKKVFELEPRELAKLGFADATRQQIKAYTRGAMNSVTQGVERDIEWLCKDNCHILTVDDPLYPPLLLAIHDAPPLLFVHGNPLYLRDTQVAIVGSRHPSRGGVENARAFSSHLLNLGILPTSGLALGIDGAAHQAAVDTQSPTIAVTGNGLDIVYPKKHHRLSEQIVEHGAIVTEFGTGVAPQASHFPRRNRIISGLSVGVLVVEAALKSGSLITARMALEQGREVFAIPGSIHNPMAKGCHTLIREGAKLVETAEHILEEVQSLLQLQYSENSAENSAKIIATAESKTIPTDLRTLPVDMGETAMLILKCLSYEPTPTDLLVQSTGLESKMLASEMVLLEIKGYVISGPGGYTLSTAWQLH